MTNNQVLGQKPPRQNPPGHKPQDKTPPDINPRTKLFFKPNNSEHVE